VSPFLFLLSLPSISSLTTHYDLTTRYKPLQLLSISMTQMYISNYAMSCEGLPNRSVFRYFLLTFSSLSPDQEIYLRPKSPQRFGCKPQLVLLEHHYFMYVQDSFTLPPTSQ
jgi:hypothetical protein